MLLHDAAIAVYICSGLISASPWILVQHKLPPTRTNLNARPSYDNTQLLDTCKKYSTVLPTP